MNKKFNTGIICYAILILMTTSGHSQSLLLESEVIMDQFVTNDNLSDRFDLLFGGDFKGNGQFELLIQDNSGSRSVTSFFNLESNSISSSITGEDVEGGFNLTDVFRVMNFRGEKNKNLLVENFFFDNSRIYDPLARDVLIDSTFLVEGLVVGDLNGDGFPELMGGIDVFTDKYEFYTYYDKCNPVKIFEAELTSPLNLRYNYIIQADLDPELEVMLIGFEGKYMIDPFENKVEPLSLPFGSPQDVISFMDNGQPKLLCVTGGENLVIYDPIGNIVEKTKKISSYSDAAKLVSFYDIDNNGLERLFFVLLNSDLTLLDSELNVIEQIEDIGPDFFNRFNRELILHDSDKDGKPNVTFQSDNKILTYEILGLSNYYESFELIDHYPSESQIIPNAASFFLEFNSSVSVDSLRKYLSLVDCSNDLIASYSIESKDSLSFNIIPQNTLLNGDYKLVLDRSFSSISNARLDHNQDSFINSSDISDFEINFEVLQSGQLPCPGIQLLSSVNDSIYKNTSFPILIEANSNIDDIPIKSVEAGFQDEAFIAIRPTDKVFNQRIETFETLINTDGKSDGTYTYQVIVETYVNTFDTLEIPIRIVQVEGYPFSVDGANFENTNYQARANVNNIFKYKWAINTDVDNLRDAIVGEDGYIYIIEEDDQTLKKVNIDDGITEWQIIFDVNSTSITVKDGVVYCAFKSNDYSVSISAFNTADGSLIWDTYVDDNVNSGAFVNPIVLYKDYLLFPYQDGIQCLDRWTGKIQWHKLDNRTNLKHIFALNDLVYAVDQKSLITLDITNGKMLYNKLDDNLSSFNGDILLDTGNNQIVLNDSPSIYAYDLDDFSINWELPYTPGVNLLARKNVLYLSDRSDGIFTVDILTGVIIPDANVYYSGININDVLIVGNMLIVSRASGTGIYNATTLKYLSQINVSGKLSMVDNLLLLTINDTTTAFEMQPNCYENVFYTDEICYSDTFFLANNFYTETGLYIDTIIGGDSCHTIATIDLLFSEIFVQDTLIMNDSGSQNGQISISIAGGVGPYTYLWSQGDTVPLIDNLSYGIYSVIVTDSIGCTQQFEFSVRNSKCDNFGGDSDNDCFCATEDCDDEDENINPSQNEILYNGIDEDCDPSTLDDDLDQDGYGISEDCDDNDAAINPSETEVFYNGIDDDCNPLTLDDDLDQDGFVNAVDCDDNNADINTAMIELAYNGLDDDCNPLTVDDDLDQDGYGIIEDCDDMNALVNPSVAEIIYNGIDDDCDPSTLDDDLDQDGFADAVDCDDNNADINTAMMEVAYNGLDDDCDPLTVDDDLDQDGYALADDCDDMNALVNPSAAELIYNGIDDDCDPTTLDDDLDQDGFLLADDCDDADPNINPDAQEIVNNGIDEDCDGNDLVSGTHDLSNIQLTIHPNPAVGFVNVTIDSKLDYQTNLYTIGGKLMQSTINTSIVNLEFVNSGLYLLEIIDLNTGNRVVERIVIDK